MKRAAAKRASSTKNRIVLLVEPFHPSHYQSSLAKATYLWKRIDRIRHIPIQKMRGDDVIARDEFICMKRRQQLGSTHSRVGGETHEECILPWAGRKGMTRADELYGPDRLVLDSKVRRQKTKGALSTVNPVYITMGSTHRRGGPEAGAFDP